MKVLFVGEGRTDIGAAAQNPAERRAGGPIPVLARKIIQTIDPDCPAISWRDVARFSPDKQKPGFEYRVAAAILVSIRTFDCQATICVTDQDGDESRIDAMNRGRERGLSKSSAEHRCVCGVAIQSIEAWSLGVPDAIASVLNLDESRIRGFYPHHRIEELHERSGKEEHRPKVLIEKLAQLQDRGADVEFREEIAENTDIAKLERACQLGFKPFAEALRIAFPPDLPPHGGDCAKLDAGSEP